jgi:hypothetical protein
MFPIALVKFLRAIAGDGGDRTCRHFTIPVQFQPIATEPAIALIGLLLVELFLVRDRLFAVLVQLFLLPITANFLHYPTSAAKVTQHFDTYLAKFPIPLLTVQWDNDRAHLQQLID